MTYRQIFTRIFIAGAAAATLGALAFGADICEAVMRSSMRFVATKSEQCNQC
jgi:hypothetical protein